MTAEHLVVLTTCGNEADAQRIARHLVERRVAACVNVVPGVTSFYWWKGAIEQDAEWLLIAKTTRTQVDAFERELKAVHPYEVPEMIALPVERGSKAYLDWVSAEAGGLP